MNYALVLTYHPDYASCLWSISDNDYATLAWDDANAIAKPTQAELDAAWESVQYDRAYQSVREARHAAYGAPDGPDALYLQWQRGDATEQDWLDAVQAVKDAHPYPDPIV